MDGNRTNRVFHFYYHGDDVHREADQNTGYQADDAGANGVDEAAGSRDRYQSGQQSIARHRRIRLSITHPHVKHRAERPGHARQHGIHRDGADAQIAVARSAESGSGIKAEPAERQDETASQDNYDVVSNDGVRPPLARVL